MEFCFVSHNKVGKYLKSLSEAEAINTGKIMILNKQTIKFNDRKQKQNKNKAEKYSEQNFLTCFFFFFRG